MGCDIHAFLEYKSKVDATSFWEPFSGELNIYRNYDMFALLAGVRGFHNKSLLAKGLPKDLSYELKDELYYAVNYSLKTPVGTEVDVGTALRWANGNQDKLICDDEHNPIFVQHPDFHTPSWVSYKEYKNVCKNYIKDHGKFQHFATVWEAILILMEHLENKKFETRLVFWFDS